LAGAEDRARIFERVVRLGEGKFNAERTVAIDFDGVIHAYSQGWFDGSIYDRMMPGCQAALWKLHKRGFNLVVFTARKERRAIAAWIRKNMPLNQQVPFTVTDRKPRANWYIDDRAVRFTTWPDMVNYIT